MMKTDEKPLPRGNADGAGANGVVAQNDLPDNSISQMKENFKGSVDFNIDMLKNVKGSNGQYSARCPAHDDRQNSLSVKIDRDRVLLHCFAGCQTEDILRALNLSFSTLFFNKKETRNKKIRKPKRNIRNVDSRILISSISNRDIRNVDSTSLMFESENLMQSRDIKIVDNDIRNLDSTSLIPELKNLIYDDNIRKVDSTILISESENLIIDNSNSDIRNVDSTFLISELENQILSPDIRKVESTSLISQFKKLISTIGYQYFDPFGSLAYTKKRYDYSDGSKSFAFFAPDGHRGVKGISRMPYNLPAVMGAEVVYFVEGEKAADAVNMAGRVGTSLDAGANSKWLPEYTQYFSGKQVIILPDNDDAGIKYARRIAGQLPGSKIIMLPRLADKGDIYDWLNAGHNIAEIDDLPEADFEDTPPAQPLTIPLGFIPINPFETPESRRRYRWNDIGVGNLFADCFKDISRFVPEAKAWYVYDGRVWRQDVGGVNAAQQAKLLTDYMLDCRRYLEDEQRESWITFVSSLMKKRARDTMLADAASVYPVSIMDFDRDPYLFNCQNYTIDLRDFNYREHRPDDFLSKISNVVFDADAHCERWDKFIGEVMKGNVDTARFLQKALGYTLTGDTSQECFFILYGSTTRNGKGTTMETILHMLGDYGRTAQPETVAQKLNTHGGGPSEDVARLKGARFVNMSEPEKGLRLNSALVKQITGGDTVTARFLHQNSFEYKPEYKLFISTNHLPRVTDDSIFASGRVKLIPFERHFSENEQDKGLKGFFKQEENISGIFNWLAKGLSLLQAEGLKQPRAVSDATNTYREESDIIGLFIKECLEAKQNSDTLLKEIHAAYTDWCDEYGYTRPISSQSLSAELRRKGIEVKKGNMNKSYVLNYGII